MLACIDDISIFTENRKLMLTSHPTAFEPYLGRHKVLKAIRWALCLSAFSYTIVHVCGKLNRIADMMTRWIRGYLSIGSTRGRITSIHDSAGLHLVTLPHLTVLTGRHGVPLYQRKHPFLKQLRALMQTKMGNFVQRTKFGLHIHQMNAR